VSSSNGDRAALTRTLQPTPDCIPIERFADVLTATESEHMKTCPRCQTEVALWQAFETTTTANDERDAVKRITGRLRDAAAASAPPKRAWRWLAVPRLVAAAAALAFVAVIGYGLWDPEPSVRVAPRSSSTVYRTLHVQPLAPLGDVASAPRTLQWAPLDGAVAYEVSLREVDGTMVWRETTSSARVDLPAAVVAQLAPGRTLSWSVAARNAAGDVVAESGAQRFRVTRLPDR